MNNSPVDQTIDNLHDNCDFILLKLYFKREVICGFPDVSQEVIEELRKMELLTINDSRCRITAQGKYVLLQGGVKRYLKSQEENQLQLVYRKEPVFSEYPLFVAISLGLISIICILTWIYFLVLI